MLILFLFLVLILYKTEATYPDSHPQKVITFEIQSNPLDDTLSLTCDHSDDKTHQNKYITYTVLEGEPFKIVAKYEYTLNYFQCHAYTDGNILLNYKMGTVKHVTIFMAKKTMGTIWKCTIFTHQDNPTIRPIVQYMNHNYSAAYCFMKVHVRQKDPPQTILVNNMVLPVVRTDLSEKDIDFTAEYQYADGDVVNVTCANFLNKAPLMMKYEMAGTMSDKSTMEGISSSKMIGFVTKLHSGHNNSYIICTNTETTDYTKIIVRFVMRTTFNNIISISINGMILRPHLTIPKNNHYEIEYKYVSSQPINVTCETERTDVKLVTIGDEFSWRVHDYRPVTQPNKVVMKFSLDSKSDNKLLVCAADYFTGGSAEQVYINFTTGNFPIEQYPLQMKFSSNGTVMELYNDYKLRIIFCEFRDGETLKLTCGPLHRAVPGPVRYIEFNDTEKCITNGCSISKTLRVTRENVTTPQICYLKEGLDHSFNVLREIRVIFRERVLATTTSTTTSTPSTAITVITTNTALGPAANETSHLDSSNSGTLVYSLSAAGIAVIIIILVVLFFTMKKRCYVKSNVPLSAPRPDPATVFYENLLSVFKPINEREAAEIEMNNYEEIK